MKINPPIIGPLVRTRLAAGAILGFLLIQPASATPWITNSPLNLARHSHTSTLLSNGKVLVVGGVGRIVCITDSGELYGPTTGANQPTGHLNIFRRDHTATLLLNGKVLVAGGFAGIEAVSDAELYDPATGNWTPTGTMNSPREFHTAALMPNGMVLVAGGRNGSGALQTAELYNPAIFATWSLAQDVSIPDPGLNAVVRATSQKDFIPAGITFPAASLGQRESTQTTHK